MSWAIWVTGLPGSGKSVLARAVAEALRSQGERVVLLELDQIRRFLTPEPTYSADEREVVYRALVYLAQRLTGAGVPVIIDATGHRRAWRDLARASIPAFAEVQLECPLEICQERERHRPRGNAPPGIYAHGGRAGATVPGVDVPYEPALAPELRVDTAVEDLNTAARRIVALARSLGGPDVVPPRPSPRQWAIWITGRPGSGKTTLAWRVAEALEARGIATVVLDPMGVRLALLHGSHGTAFEEDVLYRTLIHAAELLTGAGVPVLIDATAHRRIWREMAREHIPHFAEVQLVCPREICDQRERAVRWNLTLCAHGTHRKAAVAEGPDVVVEYEESQRPELTLHTDVQHPWPAAEAILLLVGRLRERSHP